MIRQADRKDIEEITELASLLWENSNITELKEEFYHLITKDDGQIFLKYDGHIAVGFAQCQLRYDYVEGTKTSPVGYLEGIFVKENYRNRGYAKELLLACENWAKTKGCLEFASDCILENHSSLEFHLAMGFQEANRIICFAKTLAKETQ
ncbi:MAG: GNAT family N-acetyltransferase [Prevotella sp.]|nr:GNAT family N-acetyltransferase [Staphylococcus sp.]MCM1349752.1 GNAT family N-acetyltransferase [Prevotella sp.]